MTPLRYAERIAYSSKEVLQLTYDMALQQKKANGIFVECGVAAGAQVIAMLAACPGHEVWAFDSFEGIPLPSNRDDQMPGITLLAPWQRKALPDPGKQELKSSGATIVSQADFMDHIRSSMNYYDYQSLIIFDGWFEEVIPKIKDKVQPISLLRLDGDLYNSTLVCLKGLFDKVIPGGCVIIDDFALYGCREACNDYFTSIGYTPDYKFIEGPDYKVAYFYK